MVNRFNLRLDFTEPPGFSSYNPWEQPTPNSSRLEVIGNDHTWVTAVYESTLAYLRRRSRRRRWLHTLESFNILNYFVGFPAAFWIVYRIDSSFDRMQEVHTALRGAIYVYIFLMALLAFRVMLWILRWIFPVVEMEGARSKNARRILGGVVGSLFLALLYDVLRTIVKLSTP